MMGFAFKKPVDPDKPLDSKDLPPEGWDDGIDTHDYRGALYGHPSQLFIDCLEWQQRENERISKRILE